MLEAIIFDFDGLILDTEATILESWAELYATYGVEIPMEKWLSIIGTDYGPDTFDPFGYLEAQAGVTIDWAAANKAREARELEILADRPVMPGVVALLDDAAAQGVRLAVGSSSPHSWVDMHLKRLGLFERFEAVVCADDVPEVKPAPHIFLKAVAAIATAPERAVVLEDSAHGIEAARRAGIRAVAVPNSLTRHMEFDGAALRVASLAEVNVARLRALFAG